MADLTSDAAHLLGVFIGLLLYGFYVCIFSATMYELRHRIKNSKIVVMALVAIFFFSSGYYSLAGYDIFLAFVPLREKPGTLAYFDGFDDPYAAAKDILYMSSLLVADSLLLWRLFVIWPENRIGFRIVLVTMTGLLVCGFFIGILEIKQTVVADGRYVDQVYIWTIAASGIIIVNNLITTGCIAWRLWWMSRQVAELGRTSGSLYNRIIYILVQSGSLYLSCMILQVVLYASGIRSAIYLFLHISPAIVAIFPTAIVFQLNIKAKRTSSRAEPTLSQWAAAWPNENTVTKVSGGSNTITNMDFVSNPGRGELPPTMRMYTDVEKDPEMGIVVDELPLAAAEATTPMVKFSSSSPMTSAGAVPSAVVRAHRFN